MRTALLFLLAGVVVFAAVLFVFAPEKSGKPEEPVLAGEPYTATPAAEPVLEGRPVKGAPDGTVSQQPSSLAGGAGQKGSVLAIVIDDMGADLKQVDRIIETNALVTFAVMPWLVHSRGVAERAHEKGFEVILHLPMEPHDLKHNNPGRGALFTGMAESEIKERLKSNIDAVPHIDGVNNHMGSRFTEDEQGMRTVLGVLKERGLFFLDSRTTAHSAVDRAVKAVGVRSAARDVFIDNELDAEAISRRIIEAIKAAKKHGSAIAIGHPHAETIKALSGAARLAEENGVTLIKVSELVR